MKMNNEIENKDQWLENIKKRNDVNAAFEKKSLQAKKMTMKDLDYVKIPEKINIIGMPGEVSVKSDKNVRGANKIHGGAGTPFDA